MFAILLLIYIVFTIVILLAIFSIIIFLSPSSLKAAFMGAPFLPTPKGVIRKALRIAKLKPNENFYDLGSGTGRALIIGSKEFRANSVGIEYSLPLFCLSKINLFIHGIRNGNIYRGNFYEQDYKNADVVFMFLTPRTLGKLENKLRQELKTGSRIIIYSSAFPSWKPQRIIMVNDGRNRINLFLYIKN